VIRFCQLLEPTVGGINLEDIRSPDCFLIEERLRATLSIPVSTTTSTAPPSSRARRCSTPSSWWEGHRHRPRRVRRGRRAAIATADHYVRLG